MEVAIVARNQNVKTRKAASPVSARLALRVGKVGIVITLTSATQTTIIVTQTPTVVTIAAVTYAHVIVDIKGMDSIALILMSARPTFTTAMFKQAATTTREASPATAKMATPATEGAAQMSTNAKRAFISATASPIA